MGNVEDFIIRGLLKYLAHLATFTGRKGADVGILGVTKYCVPNILEI